MKTRLNPLFLTAGALILSACAPVTLLNNLTPSSAYDLQKDVPFSQSPALSLDVYTPVTAKPDAPIVMFVHGGSWKDGSKDIYKFIGEAFSSEGYTTLIPNYRKYPDVIYPEFVNDASDALAYASETYKRPVVLVGHSAGAHIISLVALNPEYTRAAGVDRCKAIAGWVGLAGPYDFKVYDPPFLSIFPEDSREVMLPIKYAQNAIHPAMTVIGSSDTTVSPAQTERMAKALRGAGVTVTESYYPDVDHTGIIANMSKLLEDKSDVQPQVMQFIAGLPKPNCG